MTNARKAMLAEIDGNPESYLRKAIREGSAAELGEALDLVSWDKYLPEASAENCGDELCDRCMRVVSEISHTEDGQTVCSDCAGD